MERIVATCLSLATFPERGTRRDVLWLSLRTTTFRYRVTIASHITDSAVMINRVLYGGRNLQSLFDDEDDA